MNVALLESCDKQICHAGGKAKRDALEIAVSEGYRHIPLFHRGDSRLLIPFEILGGCVRAVAGVKKGETLLVQYGNYPSILNKLLFAFARFFRNARQFNVIVLIHDVRALREGKCGGYGESDSELGELREEMAPLRDFSLIYHSEQMREKCEAACQPLSSTVLGIFDYLYAGEMRKRSYSPNVKVVIAGNLAREKAGYVYKLPDLGGGE